MTIHFFNILIQSPSCVPFSSQFICSLIFATKQNSFSLYLLSGEQLNEPQNEMKRSLQGKEKGDKHFVIIPLSLSLVSHLPISSSILLSLSHLIFLQQRNNSNILNGLDGNLKQFPSFPLPLPQKRKKGKKLFLLLCDQQT